MPQSSPTQMRIAVIPARGGSKRIPRKNIALFGGRPMLAWSIQAAVQSKLFDHIIVSTDDPEIAEVAQVQGATVPFVRPAHLSDDHTGITAVVAHTTAWALEQGWELEAVCCILATAPFIQPADLQEGLLRLRGGGWLYCFSVAEYSSPVLRAFFRTETGGLEMLFPDHFHTRSQDLAPVYYDAAQFYWGRPEAWLQGQPIFSQHSNPLVLPHGRVQDIDTLEDWKRAERIAGFGDC